MLTSFKQDSSLAIDVEFTHGMKIWNRLKSSLSLSRERTPEHRTPNAVYTVISIQTRQTVISTDLSDIFISKISCSHDRIRIRRQQKKKKKLQRRKIINSLLKTWKIILKNRSPSASKAKR